MDITITENALARLRELLAAGGEGARVRLNVHGAGCVCG